MRTFENAVEGVIIEAADRVVFVIVAAGAGERQAEHRLAERVDGVFDGEVVVFDECRSRSAGRR